MADCKEMNWTVAKNPVDLENNAATTRKSISERFGLRNGTLHDTLTNAALSIQDWTPFMLVTSYFVFSTCLYMFMSPKLFTVFWFIYLTTNFYIAGSTVLEAFMSLSPIRDARKQVRKLEENEWKFPTPDADLLTLDLLIVAYLPNEKDIIMGRINYALEKIVYPQEKIRINIVYNTPYAIEPLETEMRELAAKHSHLRIIKVPGSTSKADNLNYFLSLDTGSDIISIFDCDHYTHPYGPRFAVERFIQNKKIDIVQGRCVVFNANASFLASMISVEFDKIYAVSHPGRSEMWGFALFTGSNGYWRAPFLRQTKMHTDMLTEDIDSALRSLAANACIVHDTNVVSYELAPTQFSAFWKQRLRWAQGWAQASLKHCIMTFNKPQEGKRDFSVRFGILSLLLIRELSYYLVTQYCCLVFSIILLDFPKSPMALARLVFFEYPASEWFFIISAICLVATLVITARVKSEFTTGWNVLVYAVLYPIYLIFMAVIGLYGHARQITKYAAWNPTART